MEPTASNRFRVDWRDDRGAAMGEYGMLLALIGLALVTTIISFRGSVFSSYNDSQADVQEVIDEGSGISGIQP